MNLRESVKPLDYLKSNADEVLMTVGATHCPLVITHEGEAEISRRAMAFRAKRTEP